MIDRKQHDLWRAVDRDGDRRGIGKADDCCRAILICGNSDLINKWPECLIME